MIGEIETAYRRGYVEGAKFTTLNRHQAQSTNDVLDWINGPLLEWSRKDHDGRRESPPMMDGHRVERDLPGRRLSRDM